MFSETLHVHACRDLTLEGTDVVVVGMQEVEMGTASVFR
jgi:hypothetical protein